MIKNENITLMCELCGGGTGVVLKLGDLADKLPDLKPEGDVYLHGICQNCQVSLDEGCVFFVDEKRRVMQVTVEGTKEKIAPEFWGKIVKIPASAMQELIVAYANANHKPPASNN